MNPKIDDYLNKLTKWRDESNLLRSILLECGLDEELKWGKPCYSHGTGNIAIIQGFKDYCALLFMKGALLKDPEGILITQTDNVQAARQLRFTSTDEISRLRPVIKAYISEASENEKAGLKVELKKTSDFPMPEEFQRRLDDDEALKTAFTSLTPGRQRAYILHFSSAKQSKTRESRIEQCIPAIFDGIGLNDR